MPNPRTPDIVDSSAIDLAAQLPRAMPSHPLTHSSPGVVRPMASIQRTREMTLDEIMLENRVVFLIGEINHASAARVMMQMLYLEDQKRGREINFYINSPGGAVDDTLAIYDTMQHLRAPVSTFCVGMAASMGAVLLAAGAQGKRSALPNSRIMIHQPSGGSQGTASDIEIAAKEILHIRERLNQLIAKHTGQSVETIEEDADRDRFMSPEDAVGYGLIDQVLEGPVQTAGIKSREKENSK